MLCQQKENKGTLSQTSHKYYLSLNLTVIVFSIMFLLPTGTHWTLCSTAKRLLTTTIPKRALKKVIDNGQTVTEIHVVGRKKPRSRLSEKLQKLREEGWKKIDHIKYKGEAKYTHNHPSLLIFSFLSALAPPKEVEVATLAHGLDKVLFR
jgi:hypothetical protein